MRFPFFGRASSPGPLVPVRAGHAQLPDLLDQVPVELLAPAESYVRADAGYLNEIDNPRMDDLNRRYLGKGNFDCPPIRAFTVENAVVFDSGTVLTADNRLILATFNPANKQVVNRVERVDHDTSTLALPQDIPVFPGTHYLVKRIGSSNYSHWLLEMFPRIPLLRERLGPAFDDIRLIVPAPPEPLGTVLDEMFDWAGVGSQTMATGHDFVGRFERLIVPVGLSAHPFWLHPAAIRSVERLAVRSDGPPPGGRWLFVSRKDSKRRVLLNEDEVFDALQRRFPQLERVVCSGLSFARQRELFAGASVVVAVMGGSFGNIVFSPRGGRAVVIGPGQYADLFFRNLATQKEMSYLEVRGRPQNGAPQASFRLARTSLDRIIEFLGQPAEAPAPPAATVGPSNRRRISSGSSFEATIGYSRAVVCDGWVFVSGTTGYDYASMTLPEGVEDQCRNTLANIAAALAQAGARLDDVVRVRYILPDRTDFPKLWPQLSAAFATARPAATMIEARLMEDAMRIEIEVTARLPGG